jgi:phosphatidate phosphatase APP1
VNRIFFPSLGTRATDGGWLVEVHAWCFRMHPLKIVVPVVRKLLGFERTRLTVAQKDIFAERARWIFVDNKRHRMISVSVGGEVHVLGKTNANGHLRARFTLKLVPGDAAPPPATAAVLTEADGTPGISERLEIHFLEEEGLSVISDIDDTIRVSNVRDRAALLRGTFLEPFRPVPGMADVYRGWAASSGAQFHYVSATPWQLYVPLAGFIDANGFPRGTFHFRDFRWRDRTFFSLLAAPDRYKLKTIEPLLRRLPHRRFALVGDSGQQDPEVFGELARRYPRQVRRIFIRNLMDSVQTLRYRAAFGGVSSELWSIFSDPATLPRVLIDGGPRAGAGWPRQ